MKRPQLLCLMAASIALGTSEPVDAQSQPSPPPALPGPRNAATKIILVGDSTVAVATGWGASFCARHVTPDVACVNLARQGRSTSSFRREGFWELARGEMSVPGYQQRYVLIQFGHNDQPGKPGHSTDLTTEFPDNIARYVDEARALGAVPVIVTPLTRRAFVNGKLDNSLEPWAEAERQVARQHNALLVDLNAESVAAIQQMGALASTRLAQSPPSKAARSAAVAGNVIQAQLEEVASPVDTFIGRSAPGVAAPGPKRVFDVTHLGDEGADYFSAMIAKSLAAAAPELAAMLLP